MTKVISFLFVVLGAFLVSQAIGCGGSDSALSKEEFIAKADAICKKADKAQGGEAAAYQKAHSKELVNLSYYAQIAKLVPVILLPSIEAEAEKIEALGAPSGDEQKIEEFINALHEAIKKAEKAPGSIERPPGSGGPFRVPGKLAAEYGFKDCAEIT
jgi:hypothetical protein